jgi:hypothetical protein
MASTRSRLVAVSIPAPQRVFDGLYNVETRRSSVAQGDLEAREIATQVRLTPSEAWFKL